VVGAEAALAAREEAPDPRGAQLDVGDPLEVAGDERVAHVAALREVGEQLGDAGDDVRAEVRPAAAPVLLDGDALEVAADTPSCSRIVRAIHGSVRPAVCTFAPATPVTW
jgi:hypothetical protein